MFILQKIYSFFVDTIQTILLAASVFLVVYVFLFRPFQVNGQSMYPNFHDQQFVLTSLISLKTEELKRGDVIVFQAPTDADKDYIKRVIGLPGDRVSIRDGQVFVNSTMLDEHAYLSSEVKTFGGSFLQDGSEVTVPQENYFVIGDNRSNSSDSREWGFVTMEKIIGKSMVIYWPVKDFQVVKNPFSPS